MIWHNCIIFLHHHKNDCNTKIKMSDSNFKKFINETVTRNNNVVAGISELGIQTICHVLNTKDTYCNLNKFRKYCLEFNIYDRAYLVNQFEFKKPEKGQLRLLSEIPVDIKISDEQFNFNIEECDYDIYKEKEKEINRITVYFKTKYPDYSVDRINKIVAYNSSIKDISTKLMIDLTIGKTTINDIYLSMEHDIHNYRKGLIQLKAKMNHYKQIFPEFSNNRLYCIVSFSLLFHTY